MDEKIVARFWSLVDKKGPDDCWPWLGAKHHFGHGKSAGRGPYQRAHRLSWAIHHGALPADPVLRHMCDNPGCCNPAHLQPGTQRDNVHDAFRRSRHTIHRGERNSHSKLTDAQRLDIRALRPGLSYQKIADRFGVTYSCIYEIVNGRTDRQRLFPDHP